MTRDNSVWRCPLHKDGTTTKVARFCEPARVRAHASLDEREHRP